MLNHSKALNITKRRFSVNFNEKNLHFENNNNIPMRKIFEICGRFQQQINVNVWLVKTNTFMLWRVICSPKINVCISVENEY